MMRVCYILLFATVIAIATSVSYKVKNKLSRHTGLHHRNIVKVKINRRKPNRLSRVYIKKCCAQRLCHSRKFYNKTTPNISPMSEEPEVFTSTESTVLAEMHSTSMLTEDETTPEPSEPATQADQHEASAAEQVVATQTDEAPIDTPSDVAASKSTNLQSTTTTTTAITTTPTQIMTSSPTATSTTPTATATSTTSTTTDTISVRTAEITAGPSTSSIPTTSTSSIPTTSTSSIPTTSTSSIPTTSTSSIPTTSTSSIPTTSTSSIPTTSTSSIPTTSTSSIPATSTTTAVQTSAVKTVLTATTSSRSSTTMEVPTTTIQQTTTEKQLCIPYTCTSDSSKIVSEDGVVPAGVDVGGILRDNGDRLYMISSGAKSWADAASACCTLGMQLLSLESEIEYYAISEIFEQEEITVIEQYFNSGSDNKVEKSYVWCSANNIAVSYTSWAAGEPSDMLGTENCLAVTTNPGNLCALSDKPCTSPLKYICEASSVNAAAECCKRKMRLAAVETDEEQMCLANMLNTPDGNGLDAWWWVSASDLATEDHFLWCYPDGGIDMTMSSIITWNKNQPDNAGKKEHCVNVIIRNGKPPLNLVYNDYVCSVKQKFICEA